MPTPSQCTSSAAAESATQGAGRYKCRDHWCLGHDVWPHVAFTTGWCQREFGPEMLLVVGAGFLAIRGVHHSLVSTRSWPLVWQISQWGICTLGLTVLAFTQWGVNARVDQGCSRLASGASARPSPLRGNLGQVGVPKVSLAGPRCLPV